MLGQEGLAHSWSDTEIGPFSPKGMGRPLVNNLFCPYWLSRTEVFFYLFLLFADRLNTSEIAKNSWKKDSSRIFKFLFEEIKEFILWKKE